MNRRELILNSLADVDFHDKNILVGDLISKEKKFNAFTSHSIPIGNYDDIILIVDDTVFGSAKEGIVVTDKCISVKQIFNKPIIKKIEIIKDIKIEGRKVFINGEKVSNLAQPSKSSLQLLSRELQKIINICNNL